MTYIKHAPQSAVATRESIIELTEALTDSPEDRAVAYLASLTGGLIPEIQEVMHLVASAPMAEYRKAVIDLSNGLNGEVTDPDHATLERLLDVIDLISDTADRYWTGAESFTQVMVTYAEADDE